MNIIRCDHVFAYKNISGLKGVYRIIIIYNELKYEIYYCEDYKIQLINVINLKTNSTLIIDQLANSLKEFVNSNKNIIHNFIIFEQLLIKHIKEKFNNELTHSSELSIKYR